MTDKELLELAAKAAGIELIGYGGKGQWACEEDEEGFQLKNFDRWNPLTDDGDALRLAVKLGLEICSRIAAEYTFVSDGMHPASYACSEDHNDDPYAATRRAIVRAAAEIGRTL